MERKPAEFWEGPFLHDSEGEALVTIYGLCDRETRRIFYIGQSRNAGARYYKHISKRFKRAAMFEIERVMAEVADEREQYWIAAYRGAGAYLANVRDGGSRDSILAGDERRRREREAEASGWRFWTRGRPCTR